MAPPRRIVCVFLVLVALSSCMAFAEVEPAATSVLLPSPSGNRGARYSRNGVIIDYGNASLGYIMIKFRKTKSRLGVKIEYGHSSYVYKLNGKGEYEMYPLQLGDGTYTITVFSKTKSGQNMRLALKTLAVKLVDPSLPFLYPNQYVSFAPESLAVAKSQELCQGLENDKDKAAAIYHFCSRNIYYDNMQAVKFKKEYVPNLDQVLTEQKGICLDYAALMACMLRVQGIPAQVVIGYADEVYHAWNHVLIDGKWLRYDPTYGFTNGSAQQYTGSLFY